MKSSITTLPILTFDVESIGLHGEAYAVGYVVTQGGVELEHGCFCCPPAMAKGSEDDRAWVAANIPALGHNSPDPFTVREKFWKVWLKWKAKGALLAADCGWPVEARFLCACIDALPEDRRWEGPYPFIEISSVLWARGINPLGKYDRRDDELPAHDPICDARQSARLLNEALN